MSHASFLQLIQLLAAEGVDFVVVGMLAGVLQGVPATTFDVDIVHSRAPENVDRLLAALGKLNATYRHDDRRLRPTTSHLQGPGHNLLDTIHGDLDCLGTIDDDKSYQDPLGETVQLNIGAGYTARVIGLRALLELKSRAGRPKDLAVLPLLEATLAELAGGDSNRV